MEHINKIKLLLSQLENNKNLENIRFITSMNSAIQQLENHIIKLDLIKISSQPSSPLHNINTNINYNQLAQLSNLHQKE